MKCHTHKHHEDGTYRRWWHWGDNSASMEYSRRGGFLGWQFGRNGDESDVGLALHAGRLGSLYLHLRARPLTKVFTVRDRGQTERMLVYEARHTGVTLSWLDGYWMLTIELDVPWNMGRSAVAGWRHHTLTPRLWLGRTHCEVEHLDSGVTSVLMPEGSYPATWQRERRTWTHPHRLGPLWDRLRGPRVRDSIEVAVEGGVPLWGKGENSWDCGMDGVFSIHRGDATVEEAAVAFADTVMRDRDRRGGPHHLPRPMTVREAGAVA